MGTGYQVMAGAAQTALYVLSNDSDPDGDTITITSVTAANHGTVSIRPGGTALLYTPPSTIGSMTFETFQYTISDGRGGTASASVSVTINKGVGGGAPL